MDKTVNIYRKLNKRERKILKDLNLDIKDEEQSLSQLERLIYNITLQMRKVLNVSITREEFISADKNFGESHKIFFNDDEEIMMRASAYNEWPSMKINVYRTLSKETKKTLKILGIELEDKEIGSKEYMEIYQELTNHILSIFSTKITDKKCNKLKFKIAKEMYKIAS